MIQWYSANKGYGYLEIPQKNHYQPFIFFEPEEEIVQPLLEGDLVFVSLQKGLLGPEAIVHRKIFS
ncbi:hypothetical protein ACFL35_15120 [Candidatus Riflebacteria bacterium]